MGSLEVCYLEEKPEIYEGPFLKEERTLINAITERLGHIIERIRVQEDKKRLEAQLRQSQKMESLGTLAGGIAHDFNNILFPIMGFAEMALEETSKESPLHSSINEILHGVKRAGDLVKQILTFSRQSGQELKPLKVQLIIKEVLY